MKATVGAEARIAQELFDKASLLKDTHLPSSASEIAKAMSMMALDEVRVSMQEEREHSMGLEKTSLLLGIQADLLILMAAAAEQRAEVGLDDEGWSKWNQELRDNTLRNRSWTALEELRAEIGQDPEH